MIDVVTAIAATVVAVVAAVFAANIVAMMRTCNCYCSPVGCKQIVAFVFAMHVGPTMFGFHAAWIYVPMVATAVRTVITIATAAAATSRS